ncbi:hypothetical protein GCM10010992_14070 [Cloacibacterium rupense]|uniref:TonB C-terminal domain-containing protein n=1 Tax=Cloacibacterium rupense TaxID=517423 RepID=A0ABQ2NJY7_9FLAO|nr:energy transducer TonB [Cloacibacterium rupense]GGP03900.1 hypothetical protein GCM10010992_14070 [Cloacibacterium rupense]
MKKLISLLSILFSMFFWAQQGSSLEYKGGREKLISDLNENLISVLKEYNFNGNAEIVFDINKNGKIENFNIFPKAEDSSFEKEVYRAVLRTQKNWKTALNKDEVNSIRVSIPIEYYINAEDKSEKSNSMQYFNRTFVAR